MFSHFRQHFAQSMPDEKPPVTALPPDQRLPAFSIEVAIYGNSAEVNDCLAGSVRGGRVVLYGGDGPLPLANWSVDRVMRLDGVDAQTAITWALARLKTGDTLTILLPLGWNGPPAEELLLCTRRWRGTLPAIEAGACNDLPTPRHS